MKHSQGTLIKQFVINAKRLKELVEYVDAMSDKRDPIAEAYKKGYIDNSINKDTIVNKAREVLFDEIYTAYSELSEVAFTTWMMQKESDILKDLRSKK